DAAAAIAPIAGQPESASERQPVLMPIELPDDLVIAAGRIQVRHIGPEQARRRASVNRIEVPIDRRWKPRFTAGDTEGRGRSRRSVLPVVLRVLLRGGALISAIESKSPISEQI